MKLLKKIDHNILSLLGMYAVVLIAMAILNPSTYYSTLNIKSWFYLFPEYGILTFGMMLCMISGGIDLSLVGIANLVGVVASYMMVNIGGGKECGMGMIIGAIIVGLIIGVLCGAFNGFLIGFLHIPPMLVTLCGLQLYTGIAMIVTTGPGITGVPQSYINIANGTIAGIPHTLPMFIIVTLVMSFLLKSTTYGQKVYFLGSNEVASKYSGINNFKVIMTTYMISGFLGAISGILTSSHYGSGKSNYNTSYTLLSLLIVVLGGVHPDGGKGKVIGVTLAIVLLQLISSAFSVLRIDTVITDLVYGLILIAVLVIINIAAKRATKVKTK